MPDPRAGFFELVLGSEDTGLLHIASRQARTGAWHEHYFSYPDDTQKASDFCEQRTASHDLYFCASVLSEPKCKKEYIRNGRAAWADLDLCPPEVLQVKPSLLVETSPGKWQAYWLFREPQHALDIERINKKIAYYHKEDGCDVSGWDLTQRLRVPKTANHKYTPNLHSVILREANTSLLYDLADFDVYPDVDDTGGLAEYPPLPSAEVMDTLGAAGTILQRARMSVNPKVWTLQESKPEGSWYKALWQLALLLFDAGLTIEETYIVCRSSACNKFKRDHKDSAKADLLLWKDICRAQNYHRHQQLPAVVAELSEDFYIRDKELLTPEERSWARSDPTIVEEYIQWASTLGDASWQYHQAGGFILLSALLGGTVQLPTSFGVLHPNLWFMIMADTTLTRKSTAMDIAIDLLAEIDSDSVLATDGSIEGLLTSLSMRPGRPSIFLKDEFSGLLEQIQKRDYYAGMLETLTKLYDGKYQKRVLRKETLEIRSPILILFAGGIKERILELLTLSHIGSGFIPRFCFICAESDVTKLRPLGPPTQASLTARWKLIERLRALWQYYNVATVEPGQVASPTIHEARLTEDAWVRYNKYEALMLEIAMSANNKDYLTPCFDRLCKSGLKVAMLLSACRMEKEVVINEQDIIKAFYYIEQWKVHLMTVVANVGMSTSERKMEKIYQYIQEHPQVARSELMQYFRLTARDADITFATLEQRGLVVGDKTGRGVKYSALQM